MGVFTLSLGVILIEIWHKKLGKFFNGMESESDVRFVLSHYLMRVSDQSVDFVSTTMWYYTIVFATIKNPLVQKFFIFIRFIYFKFKLLIKNQILMKNRRSNWLVSLDKIRTHFPDQHLLKTSMCKNLSLILIFLYEYIVF